MRNAPFLFLTLAVVLAACVQAPPTSQPEVPELKVSVPASIETVEMPANPTAETGDTSGKIELAQSIEEPSILLATWKPKTGKGPGSIYPVDPSNGEALPGYEPIMAKEHGFLHVFSQDGKRLALVAFAGQSCDSFAGGSRCRGGRGELHLVDLTTWQDVSAELPVDGFIERLAFNEDTSRLALAASGNQGYNLVLLDGYSGETIAQRALDFPAELLSFTEDGRSLVIYGTPVNEPAGMAQPDPPQAVLLDAASLDTLWEQELPDVLSGSWCLQNCEDSHELVLFANYQPGKAISPDGQRLYLVHADEDRLTTVDFDAREVRTQGIGEQVSWFERLLAFTAGVAQAKGGMEGAVKNSVLSADGRVLFTAGEAMHAEPDEQYGWIIEHESFPVQAIDLDTGRILASFKPDWQFTSSMKLTPDGSYLVLNGWAGVQLRSEVLEVEALEPVAEVKTWELQAVLREDGTLTWLGSRPGTSLTTFALLDPETFKHQRTWKEYGYWLVP